MATFNGEKFLKQQMQSILDQSYSKFDLYVNDDGSRDKTLDIIKSFSIKDNRVHVLNIKDNNNGQLYNFDKLMRYVNNMEYEYIMFSDQDDIWYKDKILETLRFMKSKENGPTLVYTNYNENNISGSIKNKYDNFFPTEEHSILLFQNWIMGCTVMINNKLLKYSGSIPPEADNHDNWVMLLALTYGNIFYLDHVTMLHRLHNDNVTNNFKRMNYFKKINGFIQDVKKGKEFRIKKLKLCKRVLRVPLKEKNRLIIEFYNCLKMKNKIQRIKLLRELKIKGLNKHETVKLFLMI
jgi:rhamnosyltransferase